MPEDPKAEAAESIPAGRGKGFFVAMAGLVVVLFTAAIIFGTQLVLGGNASPDEGTIIDGVRTFNVTAEQWSFQPSSLKVYPGEKVRFYLTSRDVWHGFAVNELNINLTVTNKKTVQINTIIPADAKGGIYTMYCSVFCGIGHPYLKGQIIVGSPELLFGIGVGKLMPLAATLVMIVIFVIAIAMERRKQR